MGFLSSKSVDIVLRWPQVSLQVQNAKAGTGLVVCVLKESPCGYMRGSKERTAGQEPGNSQKPNRIQSQRRSQTQSAIQSYRGLTDILKWLSWSLCYRKEGGQPRMGTGWPVTAFVRQLLPNLLNQNPVGIRQMLLFSADSLRDSVMRSAWGLTALCHTLTILWAPTKELLLTIRLMLSIKCAFF